MVVKRRMKGEGRLDMCNIVAVDQHEDSNGRKWKEIEMNFKRGVEFNEVQKKVQEMQGRERKTQIDIREEGN